MTAANARSQSPPADNGPARAEQPGASPARLAFALLGAPLGWILQLLADYALSSNRCFHVYQATVGQVAQQAASRTPLIVIHALCLALAMASVMVSLHIFRATAEQHGAQAGSTMETGEGRTHFLALCGLAGGLGFIVSILFDTPGMLMIPPCLG